MPNECFLCSFTSYDDVPICYGFDMNCTDCPDAYALRAWIVKFSVLVCDLRPEGGSSEVQPPELWKGNPMNEILLIFSTGVLAGIVIGILLVHD